MQLPKYTITRPNSFFKINFKLLQTHYQKQKKLLNFEGKKEETIDKRQKLKIK